MIWILLFLCSGVLLVMVGLELGPWEDRKNRGLTLLGAVPLFLTSIALLPLSTPQDSEAVTEISPAIVGEVADILGLARRVSALERDVQTIIEALPRVVEMEASEND